MKGITLIGMPAVGKSTVGHLLAKRLKWPVYDLDVLIVEKENTPISTIIKQKGRQYVTNLEAEYTLKLDLENAIFAPGGSIVYGEKCHKYIKEHSNVIWLKAPIKVIEERLAYDPDNNRGVIGLEDGGLKKLFEERTKKYRSLADIDISIDGKTAEAVAEEILEILKITA